MSIARKVYVRNGQGEKRKGSNMGAKLFFSPANAKLEHLAGIVGFKRGERPGVCYSFDLPAGKTCPGSLLCKSQAVETKAGWRIKDGPKCQYRCYSASQEVVLPPVREKRANNLEILRGLRTTARMADALLHAIPQDCTVLRLHTSGDFFSQSYFDAWILNVRLHRPKILFYAYTKAIPFWALHEEYVDHCSNLELTASMGGKWDKLALEMDYRTCRVVLSEEEARDAGLKIDHDDSHAAGLHGADDFAVLIHGTQPEGSDEGRAVYRLRKAGLTGYTKRDRGYGFKKRRK
jgi:hypothetical protein